MKHTLKKLSAFLLAISLSTYSVDAQAQVPQKFNYQGIARDAKGNPVGKQTMSIKLTVLPASDATEGEYEEIQTVTTNEFGLYTLQIGNGTPLKGEMSAVKWETGNKYIKVAIDPKGGSDYVDAGTNQLLSVPYAIYADKAGMAKNTGSNTRAANNFIEKTNGSGVVNSTSQIYDDGTNIGIGTTSPAAKFHIQSGPITDMRITSTGSGASDYATMQLFNNTGNSFGFTKASSAGGLYSPGIPRPNLALLANSGALLFNATGNIGFATRIGGSNFTRMFIDSATGNVGINTVTPSTRLDVNGQIRMQGGSPAAGKLMTSDAAGLASWTTPSAAGLMSGSGTTNYVPKFTPNGTTVGNSQIFDNGTSIGMGTATPNASTRLHLTKNSEVLRLDGSSPWLSFYNGVDYNAYLWHDNTNFHLANRKSGGGLRFLTESITRMTIDSNGYIGIGTIAPTSRLDLRSSNGDYLLANFRNTSTTNDRSSLIGMQSGNTTGATQWLMGVGGTLNGLGITDNEFYLENASKGARMIIDSFGAFKLGNAGATQNGSTINLGGKDNQTEASVSLGTNGEFFNMSVNSLGQLEFTPNEHSPTLGTPAMTIDDQSGGRVAIGTVASMPTGYKLFVEDGILTERLKVAVNGSANWADYVFADDYKLMPLEEVEAFVNQNKHLPNVPSAEEMAETGIDVAKVDAKLMEKIEELTLYMIEMKKEIKSLKAENEAMKANLKK